jgi:hypothetical protein
VQVEIIDHNCHTGAITELELVLRGISITDTDGDGLMMIGNARSSFHARTTRRSGPRQPTRRAGARNHRHAARRPTLDLAT